MIFISQFIGATSLAIGLLGLLVIVVGCIRAFACYVMSYRKHTESTHVRILLSTHMVLGLDFLVGKDIIDTIILPVGHQMWNELGSLSVIIALRILLNHFLLKELKGIQEEEHEADYTLSEENSCSKCQEKFKIFSSPN